MAIGSALVHGGLTQEHFAEWWGYGVFFLFASAAQVLLGLALLTDALPRDRRAVAIVGLVGQLALIAFYVVTRTFGIPFFGPQAGLVEDVAGIDLVAKGFELGSAILLAALLLHEHDVKAQPLS